MSFWSLVWGIPYAMWRNEAQREKQNPREPVLRSRQSIYFVKHGAKTSVQGDAQWVWDSQSRSIVQDHFFRAAYDFFWEVKFLGGNHTGVQQRDAGYRWRSVNYLKNRVQNFSSWSNFEQTSSTAIKKANIWLIFTWKKVNRDGLLTFGLKYFWYYIKAISHRDTNWEFTGLQIESLFSAATLHYSLQITVPVSIFTTEIIS